MFCGDTGINRRIPRNFLVLRLISRYSSAVPRVTGLQAALFGAFASFTLSVIGCGAGASAPVTRPDPNSLNGNWLLVGELPFLNPGHTANKNFGLAMTFSVLNGQIVAGGFDQFPCSPSGLIGTGVVVNGSIAQSGSFTAQTSPTQPSDASTLQIQGVVPSGDSSSWSGTYSFSSNDSGCPFTSSGPFNAVRISDVTGTYTGSASLLPALGATGGNSQPVSLTVTLQQGQTVIGTQSVNESLLGGSIQVQGTSCFTTGQLIQTQPQLEGNVLGTKLVATFTMDDGSHLSLFGNIEDILSSQLGFENLMVGGGKCDGQSTSLFELSRQ